MVASSGIQGHETGRQGEALRTLAVHMALGWMVVPTRATRNAGWLQGTVNGSHIYPQCGLEAFRTITHTSKMYGEPGLHSFGT